MLQGEHSAILLTFFKLPFVIKIFVLSNFEWPFYTGFTVFMYFIMTNILVKDDLYINSDVGSHNGHLRHPSISSIKEKSVLRITYLYTLLWQTFW